MIVAGIDTGMATLGWAKYDTLRRRFFGIGAFETEKQGHKAKTDDQDDRIELVADILADAICGADIVVAERRSFASAAAIGPISLCFGAIVGIVRVMNPRPKLYTAKPQQWQRAVQPDAGKRVDYDAVEAAVTELVRMDGGSCRMFDIIPVSLRTHAIDGCALALMGAFQLHKCRPIGGLRVQEPNEVTHAS